MSIFRSTYQSINPFVPGKPVLSDRVASALKDLYIQLYETPRYHQVYPDNTLAILERFHQLLQQQRLQQVSQSLPSSSLQDGASECCAKQADVHNRAHGFIQKLFQSVDCENPYIVRGLFLILLDKQDLAGLKLLVEKINEKFGQEEVSSDEENFSVVGTLLRILHSKEDDTCKLRLIHQVFEDGGIPVGVADDFKRSKGILKNFLPDPKSVISSCTMEDVACDSGSTSGKRYVRFDSDGIKPVGPLPGLPQYRRYLEKIVSVPRSLDKKTSATESSSVLLESYNKTHQVAGVTLPPVERNRKLPPIPPLSARLHPTGDRIQDRLGIKFKTEAHRRFHSMYPDAIPDLRDSHVNPKKYFFFGYHASAFRG